MIRFSKYLWLYALISGLVLIPGVYSLVRFGLRPSIDFTGGTLLEIRGQKLVAQDTIRQAAAAVEIELGSIQESGGATYLLRMKPETEEKLNLLTDKIASAAGVITVIRKETVGPVLGQELLTKAVTAAVLAIIAILLYVASAFKNLKYGVSAVVALLHDLLVVLVSFSILGRLLGVEIDTLYVTAVLTTMSFSVHDTIVVFDRIREYVRRGEKGTFAELCDQALTETMNRSLTNSMTIVFMLLALILMGGETIRWFLVALLIGTISGTYSSPFVATPILILWDRWEKRK